ncbi:MAG: hypothetical protein IPM50_09285 [Acidobacteriota bacterium]|nr:MAG: hypothetical protein IPM50_09285 [Acidobacteriota bacterium]
MMFGNRINKDSMPEVLQMKIVCGDCAGEGLLPIHTNLTTDGRCAECGGRSFEFASLVGTALARYLRNNGDRNHVRHKNTTNGEPAEDSRDFEAELRLVGQRH